MRRSLLPAAAVLLGLTACAGNGEGQLRENLAAATAQAVAPAVPDSGEGEGREEEGVEEGVSEPVEVPADLVDAEGSVIGAAYLRDDEVGAEVEVEVRGMPPGFHGMALFDQGDCATAGGTADAFSSVGELLVVLPPVLVLDDGVGGSTVLAASDSVVERLLADDGTALVIGDAVDDLGAVQELPVGSRIACAAFGDDIELDPLDAGDESSEDVEGEEDPDGIDRGTGGLENDDDEDTGTP